MRNDGLLLAGIALVSGVFAALLWSGILGERGSTALDDWGELVAPAIACVACTRTARLGGGRTRAAWALLAGAMALWVASQFAWTWIETVLGRTVPTPSIADLGYLAAIPLEIAAVLTFPSTPARAAAVLRTLLDGVLIAASLLVISAVLVLQPVFTALSASHPERAAYLAYPVGDVAVCAAIFLILSRARHGLRLSLALLGAGFVLVAVSDSAYAYGSTTGQFDTGSWLDTGWLTGYLLVALAAAVGARTSRAQPAEEPESLLQAAVPYATAMVAVIVAAIYFLRGGAGTPAIRASALGLIAVAAAGLALHRIDLLQMLRRSRATETALADTQGILGKLLESAPVAMLSVDPEGRIRLYRGHVLDRFTRQDGVVEGQSVPELLGEFPDAVATIKKAMGGSTGTVTLGSQPDEIELLCTPVFRPGGRVESVSVIALDVTAQRSLQRVVAENDAKSRLLQTVSHELRTPLNSILGFAQLLAVESTGPLNEKQLRYLNHVETSGRHLLRLINEILDLSKLASGGALDVQVGTVDAAEAVESAVKEVQPLASGRAFEVSAVRSYELAVRADPTRLGQILINLLSNAIQTTDHTGHITAACRRDGDSVLITVADDGPGIAAPDVDHVFDEHARVNGGRGLAIAGTGLGLSVSRRLAELMNGTLTVQSELGHGSTYSLRLPAPD